MPQTEAVDSAWHKATHLHYRTMRLCKVSINAISCICNFALNVDTGIRAGIRGGIFYATLLQYKKSVGIYVTKNGVCLLARWMFKVGKKRYDGTRGILPAIERKDHRTSSMFCSLSLLASCALYGGN
jgi:hypothetical protein